MHAFGHCHICKYVHKTDEFASFDRTKKYKIKQSINCLTTRVILYICFVAPAIKSLWEKQKDNSISELASTSYSIKKKDDERPLAVHFTPFHQGDPKGLTVKGIYGLNLPMRRGNYDTILLQKSSLIPQGLNNECNLQPFLA